MKLLKPPWVHYDDKPIFSVDIHQSCTKFATGGQGNDSGRIVIWNLLPVLCEEAEMDPSIPKILCQMDNHLSCVNCVRWSQNGQMLASGSDDKLVMIWKLSKGPSGVFVTGGISKNPESWKCVSTLRGHAGDVLDLAWSPQDRWLASCSVDNTVIVWDIHSLPAMVAVLKGHTGLVKGVAWDPVGKFLASQSDDRSVKIWKTSDWTCGNTITEPFEECSGTTLILRLSWSPDGQYLVSAHAMNGGGPTAQIIEREGWKCDKDFVGHRKAVTCVRFHNSILRRQAPKTNKSQQYCCLAVGSRDRSLSVWMTALQRPLVVIHDLFKDSVLDLSWGPDKYILLACSSDGTVACLQFTDKELGTPLSEEDKNILYQRIYGKSATVEVHGSSGRDLIIENAELINVVQEKVKPPIIPSVKSSVTYNLPAPIPLISENNVKPPVIQQATTPVKVINKQIETRTADGKRRITPMFIPLNQDTGDIQNVPELCSSSRTSNECGPFEHQINSSAMTISTSNATVTNITPADQTHLDSRLSKSSTTLLLPPAPTKSVGITKSSTNITHQPATAQSSNAKVVGPARINVASSGKITTECSKSISEFRIHVQNSNFKTTMGPLCKVTCWLTGTNEKIWDTFIGSPVIQFSLCLRYVTFCCQDGTVRIFNVRDGTSALPVLSLSTAAIQSTFCPLSRLAGVISESGQLHIWNVQDKTIYLSASCSDILKSGHVVQFNITENGIPFILFSNGTSYSYSKNLQCWMVLNSKDPITRHGLQTTIPKDFQKNIRTYPIMSVQASTINIGPNAIDINASNWQSSAKLQFIENQIKLCEAINSPEELKYWYSMLGYHLAGHGTEKRIRLVLDELLGPAHLSSSRIETTKILNIDKKLLLNNILDILKAHPKWQRIYMEYSEQLNLMKSFGSSSKNENNPTTRMDIL